MKKYLSALFCTALLLSSISTYAWGPTGHDVVASIAEQNLTKKARKALDKILEGKSIVYYSSWMDSIQNSPYWEYGYNKSKTWHYGNVDKGYTYQTMEKNEDGDVVTALNFITDELKNNFTNLTDSVKCDYIKMVVHMVGDMHCPMHAGRRTDKGGNGMKVKWFGQTTNLHSVWDSKIVEGARKWSYTEWTDHLDRTSKKYKKSVMCGTFEDWFNETVEGAATVYNYVESIDAEVPNLSYQFIFDFSPLLEDRLLVGGYRLAYVLNTIFE